MKKYKKAMNFLNNPSGDAYISLINCMFELTDTFILAVIDGYKNYNEFKYILNLLEKYKIKEQKQDRWAATMLGAGAALPTVYYYKTCDNTKEIILDNSKSLYDWLLPNLPEDLSFLKNDEYLMVSTSHENRGLIFYEDETVIKKLQNIKNINAEIILVS